MTRTHTIGIFAAILLAGSCSLIKNPTVQDDADKVIRSKLDLMRDVRHADDGVDAGADR